MIKKRTFRMVSCLLMSVLVMSVFCVGVVSAAPAQILETIAEFDFSDYTVPGTAPDKDKTPPSGWGAGNTTGYGTGGRIMRGVDGENVYVKLASGTGTSFHEPYITYSIANTIVNSDSNNKHFYMDIRLKFNNTSAKRSLDLRGSSQTTSDNTTITFDSDGKIYAWNNETNTDTGITYEPNAWYTLSVDYDLGWATVNGTTGTHYSATITKDGEQTVTLFANYQTRKNFLTDIKQIRFQQFKTDTTVGEMHIDDIKLSKSVGTTEITNNQTATCIYKVNNKSAASIDAILLVAIYKDGELLALNMDKTVSSIAAAGSATLTATAALDTPTAGITAKAFVWNSTDGVFKPLAGAIPIQ